MATLWNLHVYFPEELLYMTWCKFGHANHCCKKRGGAGAECRQLWRKKHKIFVISILCQYLYHTAICS